MFAYPIQVLPQRFRQLRERSRNSRTRIEPDELAPSQLLWNVSLGHRFLKMTGISRLESASVLSASHPQRSDFTASGDIT
jgi:hypothetical protein